MLVPRSLYIMSNTMQPPAESTNQGIATPDPVPSWPHALWFCVCNLLWHPQVTTTDELTFRAALAVDVRLHIQHGLWLSMGITLLYLFGPGPIAELRSASLAAHQITVFNALRFGVFLPTAIVLFAVAYSPLYKRYFAITAQFVTLAHVTALTMLGVLIRQQGYSVAVWIALALFGIFNAYGLLQHQALRTGLLAAAIYFFGSYAGDRLISLAGVSQGGLQHGVTPQWYFEYSLLLFVLLGAAATQSALLTAERAHYRAQRSLAESAQRDGLTQIHNRRAFDERIELLWNQAARAGASVTLMMIDIDFFKHYNDNKGHLAGDECLKKVAETLARCARRPMDIVARYGGEEFAVLLYDTDRSATENTATALCASVAKLGIAHPASPIGSVLTVSIGAACIVPNAKRSCIGLIQLADEALYSAKQRGRNRAIVLDKEYDTLVTGVFRSQVKTSDQAA